MGSQANSDFKTVIHRLSISDFRSNGLTVAVDTALAPLIPWLPVYFTLLKPNFYLGSKETPKMVSIDVSDMTFKLSEPVPVHKNASINFENSSALNSHLLRLTQGNHPEWLISSDLVVKLLGVVWYRSLHVENTVLLNKGNSFHASKALLADEKEIAIPESIRRNLTGILYCLKM